MNKYLLLIPMTIMVIVDFHYGNINKGYRTGELLIILLALWGMVALLFPKDVSVAGAMIHHRNLITIHLLNVFIMLLTLAILIPCILDPQILQNLTTYIGFESSNPILGSTIRGLLSALKFGGIMVMIWGVSCFSGHKTQCFIVIVHGLGLWLTMVGYLWLLQDLSSASHGLLVLFKNSLLYVLTVVLVIFFAAVEKISSKKA